MLNKLLSISCHCIKNNLALFFRSYEHAFPSDLYNSFAKAVAEDSVLHSSVNIAEFMRYWVEERGYPVLNVELNRDTGLINLSQVGIILLQCCRKSLANAFIAY